MVSVDSIDSKCVYAVSTVCAVYSALFQATGLSMVSIVSIDRVQTGTVFILSKVSMLSLLSIELYSRMKSIVYSVYAHSIDSMCVHAV